MKTFFAGLEAPSDRIRAKAWDHFQELGLPSRQMELYRYIPLRKLFAQEFEKATVAAPSSSLAPYIYPECVGAVLVFVNGCYQPELSQTEALPKQLVISPLNDAMRTYGSFLNHQWARSMKEETDPFAVANAALHSEGLFLYLPPRLVVEKPIQILSVVDTGDVPMMMNPRVHLFAGKQSQVHLVSSQAVLSGATHFLNQALEMSVEEAAHVHYTQIADTQSWHFDTLRATLKRNSHLNAISVTRGSETVRHDYRITLTGENAEARTSGLWMLDGTHEAHVHVLMDHQAPQCRSMQHYKGVLNGASRSSFDGKILVHQAAQKTDAFQLNNNLLLSDSANAETKPNLEIFADDVKASHGATVGQLDKEHLFYMKARGVPEKIAKNLLVQGFSQEIIDMITLSAVRERMGAC